MTQAPDATIAIPTLDPEPAVFGEVLESAAVLGLPVLVVDMSQSDDVRQICLRQGNAVRYVQFRGSRGVSQSRNRCAELAATRRIVFLDSDAVPEPGWAMPLLERLDESDVAIVGARILPRWATRPPRLFRSFLAGLHLSLWDLGAQPVDVARVIGTSYAVDLARSPSPPFDETIGRRPGWGLSGEENRLCVDVRRLGYRVVYEPRSVVRHHVAATRLHWRWMWSRAYSSGRETWLEGRGDPLPHPAWAWDDYAFKAAIMLPFLAGKLRERVRSLRRHGVG